MTSFATAIPRSSGFQRAREKNECPVVRPDPRQTSPVQYPADRPLPGLREETAGQHHERAERRGGEQRGNTASSVIRDARTGSGASGSISGIRFTRGNRARPVRRPSWKACRRHPTELPALDPGGDVDGAAGLPQRGFLLSALMTA